MGWRKQRDIAVSAVRSQLCSQGIDPRTVSPSDAHAVLDDLARVEPDLVASQWYQAADERQLQSFYEEWQGWLDDERWQRYLAGGPYGSLVKER